MPLKMIVSGKIKLFEYSFYYSTIYSYISNTTVICLIKKKKKKNNDVRTKIWESTAREFLFARAPDRPFKLNELTIVIRSTISQIGEMAMNNLIYQNKSYLPVSYSLLPLSFPSHRQYTYI